MLKRIMITSTSVENEAVQKDYDISNTRQMSYTAFSVEDTNITSLTFQNGT